jgi:hypothetical protein
VSGEKSYGYSIVGSYSYTGIKSLVMDELGFVGIGE